MGLPADFTPANQGGGNQIYFRDIDLSIARAGAEMELPGFSFMSIATEAFDSSGDITYTKSTGLFLAQLDSPGNPKLLCKSGSEFNVEPARKIYITNAAQPNKMLRVYFAGYPFLRQVPQFNATPSSSSAVILGANTFHAAPGGGVTAIFLPNVNYNGVLLRTAYLNPGATYAVSLYVDIAAPASWNDTTKRRAFGLYPPAPGQNIVPNLLIPAGNGMWVANGGADTSSFITGTYDFL